MLHFFFYCNKENRPSFKNILEELKKINYEQNNDINKNSNDNNNPYHLALNIN